MPIVVGLHKAFRSSVLDLCTRSLIQIMGMQSARRIKFIMKMIRSLTSMLRTTVK